MSWQLLVMLKHLLRFSLMWDIIGLSCDVVRRHTTSCDVEGHRTIVVRHRRGRTTIDHDFNLYKTMSASHQREAISQTLPMRRNPIVSSVTTKLRLQYNSRYGENVRNLLCHPSYDVVVTKASDTDRKSGANHTNPGRNLI